MGERCVSGAVLVLFATIVGIAPGREADGWHVEYFAPGGDVVDFPDYDSLLPRAVAVVPTIDVPETTEQFVPQGLAFLDHFAVRYQGRVSLPAGETAFHLTSDDGSRLFVDGSLVVDNGGLHGFTETSGSVTLGVGDHCIVVEFFANLGTAGILLEYTPPAGGREIIPPTIVRADPCSTGLVTVPKWRMLEIALSGESFPANGFTDTTLTAMLTSPTNRIIEVDGYYDGDGRGGQVGNQWKMRITPDELGTWSWVTTSNDGGLDGVNGQFSCVASGDPGPLVAVDHYFSHADGDPVFLIGNFLDTAAPALEEFTHTLLSEEITDTNRNNMIVRQRDFHRANKMNVYLANRGDYGGISTTPWLGIDSSNDKTRFDLARWRMYDQLVARLKDEGMIAQLWFFADDSNFGGMSPTNRERLIQYGLARLGPYAHSMFVLMLEWQEGWTEADVANFSNFAQSHNPWDRLWSVHGRFGDFAFPNDPSMTYMETQPGNGATPAFTNAHTIFNRTLANKPLLTDEFGFLDSQPDLRLRGNAWAAFCGGSAGIGTGSDLARIRKFVDESGVNFTAMTPNNALSSGGYVLADEGREYVVYFESGGDYTVQLAPGAYDAWWFSPRAADGDAGPVAIGAVSGGPQLFSTPTGEDWVLHVIEGAAPSGELLLSVAPESDCTEPAEIITVTLDVANLTDSINGVQALIGYDPTRLALAAIEPIPPWSEASQIVTDGEIVYGAVILGGSTSVDGQIATLTFTAGAVGATDLTFRPDDPPFFTKLTLADTGDTLFPIATDSGQFHIFLLDCAISADAEVCAGSGVHTASVVDAGPGASYDWTVTGGTLDSGAGTPAIEYTEGSGASVVLDVTVTDVDGCANSCQTVVGVNASPVCAITADAALCPGSSGNIASVPDAGVGSSYDWTVTGGTLESGGGTNVITYSADSAVSVTLDVTITTGAGCVGSCQTIVPVLSTSIAVTLEVEALRNPVTRDVTFVISDCVGPVDTRILPVMFDSFGIGSVVLADVSLDTQWISVTEGHTLRRLAAVSLDACGSADLDLTGVNRLPAGNFHTTSTERDELVDIVDFSILATRWGMSVDPNSATGADATGDGVQETADFTAIAVNYFEVDDQADGCSVSPALGPGRREDVADGGVLQVGFAANGLPGAVGQRAHSVIDQVVQSVDLVWLPEVQTVPMGGVVTIGLYAVSHSGADLAIAAMDVATTFNPKKLSFLGAFDNGPYRWQMSGFLPDPLGGLNDSLSDGDAKYTALSNFDKAPVATPGGLLVTSFQFDAVALTDATDVVIEQAVGDHAVTVVYGNEFPVQVVTGELGSAMVRVVAAGDCDGDEDVDFHEFGRMQICFTGPVGPVDQPAYPVGGEACCAVYDFDGDGDVDLRDFSGFVDVATAGR